MKNQAVIKKDEKGDLWAYCPYCNKKAVPLPPGTRVYNLPWKCHNNKCNQKNFIINYSGNLCLV